MLPPTLLLWLLLSLLHFCYKATARSTSSVLEWVHRSDPLICGAWKINWSENQIRTRYMHRTAMWFQWKVNLTSINQTVCAIALDDRSCEGPRISHAATDVSFSLPSDSDGLSSRSKCSFCCSSWKSLVLNTRHWSAWRGLASDTGDASKQPHAQHMLTQWSSWEGAAYFTWWCYPDTDIQLIKLPRSWPGHSLFNGLTFGLYHNIVLKSCSVLPWPVVIAPWQRLH